MMSEERLESLEIRAPHAAEYVRKHKLDELPNRRGWPGEYQGKPTDAFFKYLLENNIEYKIKEAKGPGKYT